MLVNKKVLSALKNALSIGIVAEHGEAIPLIQSVQPVVQVDDIKLTGKIVSVDEILDLYVNATFHQITGYTCPAGKRAYFFSVGKEATTANSEVQVTIDGITTSVTVRAQVAQMQYTGFDLWLEAGDTAGLRSTNTAADVARHFYAILVEVDW